MADITQIILTEIDVVPKETLNNLKIPDPIILQQQATIQGSVFSTALASGILGALGKYKLKMKTADKQLVKSLYQVKKQVIATQKTKNRLVSIYQGTAKILSQELKKTKEAFSTLKKDFSKLNTHTRRLNTRLTLSIANKIQTIKKMDINWRNDRRELTNLKAFLYDNNLRNEAYSFNENTVNDWRYSGNMPFAGPPPELSPLPLNVLKITPTPINTIRYVEQTR